MQALYAIFQASLSCIIVCWACRTSYIYIYIYVCIYMHAYIHTYSQPDEGTVGDLSGLMVVCDRLLDMPLLMYPTIIHELFHAWVCFLCMYAYMCVCMYVWYVCIYVSHDHHEWLHVWVWFLCMYVFYVCACTCVYVCVCMCVCMCVGYFTCLSSRTPRSPTKCFMHQCALYVCMHVCVCVFKSSTNCYMLECALYICMCVRVSVYVCMYVCM